MNSTKHYTVVNSWAGHCTQGGSNKVWAGILVYEEDASLSQPSDTAPAWHFLAVYGKTGSNLNGGEITSAPAPRKGPEAAFTAKVKEKGRHGYQEVPIAPFLPSFRLALVVQGGAVATIAPSSAVLFRYPMSGVEAIPWEQCQQYLASSLYGVSEKVNGERCLVEWDGQEALIAYNRRGVAMSAPPEAARHLCKLGCPFVVDGERLVGEEAGQYVVFDLLEWGGEDIRQQPYLQRVRTLRQSMHAVGLLHGLHATPTLASAQMNSAAEGLALLVADMGTPGRGQQVVGWLRDQAREGVIVRKLAAGYDERRAIQKYKFLSDLDAVVIGIAPGTSAGSARMGLRRPSDDRVVEIGNVRAGLVNADVRALGEMLARGEWPVLPVQYLPIRTVGITLVEPRTSLALLRTDKVARECTTDQFGPEKGELVEKAPGLDIVFP